MRNLHIFERYIWPLGAVGLLIVVLIALGTGKAKAQSTDSELTCSNCGPPVPFKTGVMPQSPGNTVAGYLQAMEGFAVQGKLLFTRSYCGGIPPTYEQQQELATPKPCPTCTIFVTKCPASGPVEPKGPDPNNIDYSPAAYQFPQDKPVATFLTEADGSFAITLPKGQYQFSAIPNLGCTTYYYSAGASEQSAHIQVGKGQNTQNLDLRIHWGCGFLRAP